VGVLLSALAIAAGMFVSSSPADNRPLGLDTQRLGASLRKVYSR